MKLRLIRLSSDHIELEPRVLAIGKFDGVHRGHAAILARVVEVAARTGTRAGVLTFEPHPRDFFAVRGGERAVLPRVANLRDTVSLLQGAGIEQLLIQRFDEDFASMSAHEFIEGLMVRRLQVKHLLVGADFRFGHARRGDLALLAEAGRRHGFTLEIVPIREHAGARISSSSVRAALGVGNFELARQMLGRGWAVSGRLIAESGLRGQGVVAARFIGMRGSPLPQGMFAARVRFGMRTTLPGVLLIERAASHHGARARVIFPVAPVKLGEPNHVVLEDITEISPYMLAMPLRHAADSLSVPVHTSPRVNFSEYRDYV